MKKITLIFVCLVLSCAVKAQTANDKTWLSVSYNNNQYGSIISAPFDDLLSVDAFSISLGVERYFGKSFDIGANLSIGKIISNGVERFNLVGLQVVPRFKLNNGKILSESSKWAPYISLGLGAYDFSESEIDAENGTFFTFSPTVGLGYRLSDNLKVWASTSYKINSAVRYREYSLGVSFSLKKKADADNDGIPDKKDECPEEFGAKENKGCPVTVQEDIPVTEEKPEPVLVDTTITKPEIREEPQDSTKVQPVEKTEEPARPVDSDQDGIADIDDKCPGQKGSIANGGCPVEETPVVERGDIYELPIDEITFAPGTAQIRNADLALLDQLAELMTSDESFKIELNGYGDGVDAATDFTLANRRVAAVKAYLVAKGRSPYRFISNVFGSPTEAGMRGKVLLKVID